MKAALRYWYSFLTMLPTATLNPSYTIIGNMSLKAESLAYSGYGTVTSKWLWNNSLHTRQSVVIELKDWKYFFIFQESTYSTLKVLVVQRKYWLAMHHLLRWLRNCCDWRGLPGANCRESRLPYYQQQAVADDRERTNAAAQLQGGPALLEAAPALHAAVDRA